MAFSAVLLFSVVSIAIPIPSAEAGKSNTITISGGHTCSLIGGNWSRKASQCVITSTQTIAKNIAIPSGVTLYFYPTASVTFSAIVTVQSGGFIFNNQGSVFTTDTSRIDNHGTITNNHGNIYTYYLDKIGRAHV